MGWVGGRGGWKTGVNGEKEQEETTENEEKLRETKREKKEGRMEGRGRKRAERKEEREREKTSKGEKESRCDTRVSSNSILCLGREISRRPWSTFIIVASPKRRKARARSTTSGHWFFGNDYAITAAEEGVFTICFGGEERVKRNEEEGKRRHTASTRVHTHTHTHTHTYVHTYACTCIYI